MPNPRSATRHITRTGHRPIPEPLPIDPNIGEPPAYLKGLGLELWESYTAERRALGVLTRLDRVTLVLTCRQVMRAERSKDFALIDCARRLLAELMATPATRMRLVATIKKPKATEQQPTTAIGRIARSRRRETGELIGSRCFSSGICVTRRARMPGEPFLLTPWQRREIIDPLFGRLRPDGRRQIRTALIELPRKNGKSSAVCRDRALHAVRGWRGGRGGLCARGGSAAGADRLWRGAADGPGVAGAGAAAQGLPRCDLRIRKRGRCSGCCRRTCRRNTGSIRTAVIIDELHAHQKPGSVGRDDDGPGRAARTAAAGDYHGRL